MISEELMVGDYVGRKMADGSLQITKVRAILNSIVELDLLDGRLVQCYVKDISPIPLTKEILVKNGCDFESIFGYFKEDKHYILEITVDRMGIWWTINADEYGILKLQYVHELQHALKLCRIDKEIVL
jgi:hypothetical protein